MSIGDRLKELGVTVPAPLPPAAGGLYAPCVQTGSLLFVSGQIPRGADARGKLGESVTVEQGQALARECALNALGIVQAHLGSLDRIVQAVRVAGYVASAEGFTDHPRVINGASQLLIDVLGEKGRSARIAIGVAELPLGVPVEVEFLFEVA
ncbi:MAG: RidA family protein [Tepidiformaceae bacterium]